MNIVALRGNATRDGETRVFDNGNQVTKFGLAVNRRVKKNGQWEDAVNFFDIEYWGKQGVSKGDIVLLNGELRQDTWETEGQKRTKVYVVANDITRFSGFKKNEPVAQTASEPQAELVGAGSDVPF